MQYQRGTRRDSSKVRTILFVEDNIRVSDIVKNIVSLATTHRTLHVADSTEALRIITQTKPDLLLLDYHLPVMNGLQLYDILHAKDEYNHIPAIIITADTSQETRYEIEKRRLMVITKPFKLVEFVNMLNTVLT